MSFNMAIRFFNFFSAVFPALVFSILLFFGRGLVYPFGATKVKVESSLVAFISAFSTSLALAEAYLRIRLPAMPIMPAALFFPRRKQARQGR